MASELGSQDLAPNVDSSDALPDSSDQQQITAKANQPDLDSVSYEDYARNRSKYVRDGGGKPPPGATPIDEFDSQSDH